MLYHCGLLDTCPETSRKLQWVKRPVWGRLPPDIERELRIFLAMPGFSASYVSHVFRIGAATVARNIGDYESWRDEVAENWLSTTRNDCIKLARLRPGTGNVPVICQLRALQDVKSGMSFSAIGREYGVTGAQVRHWARRGILSKRPLPPGFALLSA